MRLAMIGLGKMGSNMAARLLRGGHQVVAYDLDRTAVEAAVTAGAESAGSLEQAAARLSPPRVAWVMVPAGDATETTISALARHLSRGDIVVDGGNSHYTDTMRRAAALKEQGLRLVDVGTSGGVWGLTEGYCLMVGGDQEVVESLRPIFETLAPAPDRGWGYVGPTGAGHFVKMVHNGIEYGLMQAYAEGFDIMKCATSENLPEAIRYDLALGDIAEVWRRGSVIGSWLLDLTAMALAESPALAEYSGFVQDSGEGRWTVQAAIDESVPAEVITAALFARFRSRQTHTFTEKVLSAMRHKFGGHLEPPKE